MSDPSSPHDDPFAELFARLPDPRAGNGSGDPADAGRKVPPTEPRPASAEAARSAPAPMSRRAAREAAAREASALEAAAAGAAPRAAQSESVLPSQLTATEPEPARPVASAPTLDDLFAESAYRDVHADPPKKKRHIGAWIALAVVLVIVGGVAGTGVWAWNTYEDKIREVMGWEEPKDYEPGLAHGEALVTISEGDVPSAISQSLFEAGVTKTGSAFYDMLIKTAQNPTFYPGVYRLQQQMTAEAALAALKDPANKLENSALVREGLTVPATLTVLAEGLGMPIEDFQAAAANPADYGVEADSLEGWLFPAMYTFDPGATAADVIQTMVDRTVQSLDAAGVPVDKRQEILTIASIIEREARFEDDFYKVSRVIQNRLDPNNQETFGYLQMDSTAQFGYGQLHDGSASTSEEAQHDDNPWNTYAHTGLPIGPIANPGDTAIDAAMHPADGPWLYFVTVNMDTGETIFTETYNDHLKYVRQMQQWCSENPDSGC
ncbi:endolytic transglycosylase MltG [Microbacterium sp.]|uniref:endolytic transglycosylase MltG n=1 Tax=Microbacterium sp. TaxID=51671 RepID=UPI0037C80936